MKLESAARDFRRIVNQPPSFSTNPL